MINKIKAHSTLSKFIEETCCENDICVTFEADVNPSSYVIIKVDKYYNSLKIQKRPASIDCLIVRECVNGGYGITLVELKKASSAKGFEIENIKEKFETTLYKFIQKDFKKILSIEYSDIKLYFVSKKELYKRDLGLKMDVLINLRFKVNSKNFMITPKMPNPTIRKCYS